MFVARRISDTCVRTRRCAGRVRAEETVAARADSDTFDRIDANIIIFVGA
jgi:hypothetical protein